MRAGLEAGAPPQDRTSALWQAIAPAAWLYAAARLRRRQP
jgi:hypothetical protein